MPSLAAPSPRPARPHGQSHRVLRALLAATALSLVATACTGDSDGGDGDDAAGIEDRLAAARGTLDDAASIGFSLSTETLPDGVNGLLSAEGTGTPDPAFEGDVVVSTGGQALDAAVVCLDGLVYADSALLPGGFIEVDPATLGAPDPAALFDTESGVSNLLTSTDEPQAGDDERDGEDVLTTVTGTLEGGLVAGLIPTADEAGTFEVTYRLTDDDELRDAQITGPFYGDAGDVVYDLTVEGSDEAVEITAP